MGEFIGAGYERAAEAVESLTAKGLLRWGTEEEDTYSYLWISYDGPYFPPTDWTGDVYGRSARVIALIERDGPECAYCDRVPINYHVDHFIPKAKGGPDRLSNLVLACPRCNLAKKDKWPADFLRHDPVRFRTLSTNLKHLHG
jgi:hypothetical protein